MQPEPEINQANKEREAMPCIIYIFPLSVGSVAKISEQSRSLRPTKAGLSKNGYGDMHRPLDYMDNSIPSSGNRYCEIDHLTNGDAKQPFHEELKRS